MLNLSKVDTHLRAGNTLSVSDAVVPGAKKMDEGSGENSIKNIVIKIVPGLNIYLNKQIVAPTEEVKSFIKNLYHERIGEGWLYTLDEKNDFSNFCVKYKPHKWTIYSIRRDSNAPYFTNDIIKYQYNVVAEEKNFSGKTPEVIKHRYITNGATLKEIEGKTGWDLFETFLTKTPNGVLTSRLIQDFGLKPIDVTQKQTIGKLSGNLQTHIYIKMRK